MRFTTTNIQELLEASKSFSLEGFNIFAIGKDDLPHIVCTAPNKSTARALLGLLEIAKKAQDIQGIDAYITGDAQLVPQVLANGHIALTAVVITDSDTIYKDGVEVEFDAKCGTCIESGTPEYDEFIETLRKA
jgi:hypothetical protein